MRDDAFDDPTSVRDGSACLAAPREQQQPGGQQQQHLNKSLVERGLNNIDYSISMNIHDRRDKRLFN
jgi:hypothetical protein